MFSVPYSPLGSALEIPRGRLSSSEREEFVCALSQRRLFPSPKQGICFAKGEVWALESLCSFSFSLFCFFVFYCNDDIWKLFTQEHALLH